MPAKGKYLLNDQELKNEALYRKFSCNSQYQPLVLLLGLSMLACGILLILFFALQLVSLHVHVFVRDFGCIALLGYQMKIFECLNLYSIKNVFIFP